MKLGKRIRQQLDVQGKSQAWLCDRVPGLEIGTVSALINRDSEKSRFAKGIAEALGVNVEWLLDGKGPQYPVDANHPLDQYKPLYDAVSPEFREAIHNFMEAVRQTQEKEEFDVASGQN